MLRLAMQRGQLTGGELGELRQLLDDLPEGLRRVLGRALKGQAEALGVPEGSIFGVPTSPGPEPVFGELLAAEGGVVAIEVAKGEADEEESENELVINLFAVGDERAMHALDSFSALISERLDVELRPWLYRSPRMDEMLEDGMQPTVEPAADELAGARLLADRDVRTMAIAIASSGGLLVSDLPKQLPPEKRDLAENLSARLETGGLVASEMLIICRQTSRQIARVPDKPALEDMARQGLKCACGREVTDERVESALTITTFGGELLEGSRWLSVLVTAELLTLGIPADRILIEQADGGEEMDCFADVSGELVFFELKDKEFSLGNAYSFGAKIGIHRPEHSVIVTSAYVGNDAKDHFKKAERSEVEDRHFYLGARPRNQRAIRYIEGIGNLQTGLEDLIGEIYALDARRALSEIVRFASINAAGLVKALAEDPSLPKGPTDPHTASTSSDVEANEVNQAS